jgi:predicted ATPase
MEPGDRFGRYEIVSQVGSGGAGVVYAADLQGPAGFRKRVALKILRNEGPLSESTRSAFVREARLGALLDHPNVVDVYELGEQDGQLFLAMELVPGPSVADLSQTMPVLPPRAVLDVLIQTCSGLAHAHNLTLQDGPAGLVHRDLKPGNLLVHPAGLVKIADFGIATATRVGELFDDSGRIRGTLAFMSPEQLHGEPVDPTTDLWALAVVSYRLAVGQWPWRYRNLQEARDHVKDIGKHAGPFREACNQAIPGLGDILVDCLSFDRTKRPQTASQLGVQFGSLRVQGLALVDLLSDDVGDDTRQLRRMSRSQKPKPRPKPPPVVPVQGDAFVGRKAELERLSVMAGIGARLITLKGLGGAGKSRLAGRFVGGLKDVRVAWCDLTAVADEDGLTRSVATALGVAIEGPEPLAERLPVALSSYERMWVVLDRVEHLAGDARAAVGRWLRIAPGVTFLATSKQPLGVSGEVVVEVEPLDTTEAVELLRARALAQPGCRAAWRTDRASLSSISARLDGLPLALELVAGRAAIVDPADVLAELKERPRLLTGEHPDGDPRQATVRGALDDSWNLLAPEEQDALAQLSIFESMFDLDAVDMVVDLSKHPGPPWSVDVVAALHARSLVRVRDRNGSHFELLKSVRSYAQQRLAESEHREGVALRHARWCREVELGEPDSLEFGRLGKALLLDLQRGAAAALDCGEVELSARVALRLGEVASQIGPPSVGIEPLRAVVATLPDGLLRCDVHLRLAALFSDAGADDKLREHAKAALNIARLEADSLREAQALIFVSNVLADRGDSDAALTTLGAAMRAARLAGSAALEAKSRNQQSHVYVLLGDAEKAERLARAALEGAREASPRLRSVIHARLASVARMRSDYGTAVRELHQALSLLDPVAHRGRRCHPTVMLGVARLEAGDPEEAEVVLTEGLKELRQIGMLRYEALALNSLGLAQFVLGREGDAETSYRSAIQTAQRRAAKHMLAVAQLNLASLFVEQKRLREAHALLKAAHGISTEAGPTTALFVVAAWAECMAAAGHPDNARKLLARADSLFDQVHNDGARLHDRVRRARVAYLLGDRDEAARRLREADELARSVRAIPSTPIGRLLELTHDRMEA